jgi:hypothetical protein
MNYINEIVELLDLPPSMIAGMLDTTPKRLEASPHLKSLYLVLKTAELAGVRKGLRLEMLQRPIMEDQDDSPSLLWLVKQT